MLEPKYWCPSGASVDWVLTFAALGPLATFKQEAQGTHQGQLWAKEDYRSGHLTETL